VVRRTAGGGEDSKKLVESGWGILLKILELEVLSRGQDKAIRRNAYENPTVFYEGTV
jgi:hypothetical protein